MTPLRLQALEIAVLVVLCCHIIRIHKDTGEKPQDLWLFSR
jgi:hypothetical protein